MAFYIHTIEHSLSPSICYLPASAMTPKAGMALGISEGALAPVTGAAKPGYISLCERDTACEAGEDIPCMPALPTVIFETVTDADLSDIKIGDKLSISDDGTTVTAATGGAAEVLYIEKTAYGTICRVRFS